jgi:aminopeptidase
MAVPNPAAFARLLCGWCLEVERGQQVLIRSTVHAAPLLLALEAECLERGAWPLLRVELEGEAEVFHAHARDDVHLEDVPGLVRAEAKQADCQLAVQAPGNTRELSSVDPARLARLARASAPVREARMRKRWCGTLWPTAALAQQAGTGLGAYAAFVERALFIDRPDPEASWRSLSVFQARLVERLRRARELRIEADGTDLRLRTDGRTWINSDGKRNMPSGEVFTGPREDSATGTIRFSVPTGPAGLDVAGVELELRDGEVVAARAERGQAFLEQALATDAGARRLGELGIGTNGGIDRPTGTILLDEKIGGTVHVALGRSYPETGGKNVSALHWDLICDLRAGGRLTADGEVIQEGGAFAPV